DITIFFTDLNLGICYFPEFSVFFVPFIFSIFRFRQSGPVQTPQGAAGGRDGWESASKSKQTTNSSRASRRSEIKQCGMAKRCKARRSLAWQGTAWRRCASIEIIGLFQSAAFLPTFPPTIEREKKPDFFAASRIFFRFRFVNWIRCIPPTPGRREGV